MSLQSLIQEVESLIEVRKGGPNSGNKGHAGIPGHRGGSASGGGSGGSKPPLSLFSQKYGRRENYDSGLRMEAERLIKEGKADHLAIVQSAGGSKTLKKAKNDYPDSTFYLANVRTESGEKPVRFMGHMSNIPKPGDRVVVGFDHKGSGYTRYSTNVVPDDGRNASLWFYD